MKKLEKEEIGKIEEIEKSLKSGKVGNQKK